jgi:hypothetical protein
MTGIQKIEMGFDAADVLLQLRTIAIRGFTQRQIIAPPQGFFQANAARKIGAPRHVLGQMASNPARKK